ncbi:MAG: ferritin [Bacteroidales bacterium]|nr:ferritin [Candidatus Cryptobacteroides caccocaballi]
MISKNMNHALNEQINAELWSAYLYLAMSLDASHKAMEGIANWFFVQWMEEQDHARILESYMQQCGAKVTLKPISDVPSEWSNPQEMFEDTLAHERRVTEMVTDLVSLAMQEGDYATLSRLQWFIDEQVEEECDAAQKLMEFERAGKDALAIHELDEEMGERQYCTAEPLRRRN